MGGNLVISTSSENLTVSPFVPEKIGGKPPEKDRFSSSLCKPWLAFREQTHGYTPED